MAPLALAAAVLSLGALALSGIGTFAAMGFGLFALGLGLDVFRRRARPSGQRLRGALAAALGALALALAGTKYVLTLAAVNHLASLAPP